MNFSPTESYRTVHSGRKKHLIILYVRTLPTSHANKMDQSQPHAEEWWPKLVVPREHPPGAFLAKEVSNIWRTTPWTRYLSDLPTLRKSLCSCKVTLWKSWPRSVSTHGKNPIQTMAKPTKNHADFPRFPGYQQELGPFGKSRWQSAVPRAGDADEVTEPWKIPQPTWLLGNNWLICEFVGIYTTQQLNHHYWLIGESIGRYTT